MTSDFKVTVTFGTLIAFPGAALQPFVHSAGDTMDNIALSQKRLKWEWLMIQLHVPKECENLENEGMPRYHEVKLKQEARRTSDY